MKLKKNKKTVSNTTDNFYNKILLLLSIIFFVIGIILLNTNIFELPKKIFNIKPNSLKIKFNKIDRKEVTINNNNQYQSETQYMYLFKIPQNKNEILTININEAKYLYDTNKSIFVDARNFNNYKISHIKGAISINEENFNENIQKYFNLLKNKNKIIIVYCDGIGCQLSKKVAYKLFDSGYQNVVIFYGGFNEWINLKYPVNNF